MNAPACLVAHGDELDGGLVERLVQIEGLLPGMPKTQRTPSASRHSTSRCAARRTAISVRPRRPGRAQMGGQEIECPPPPVVRRLSVVTARPVAHEAVMGLGIDDGVGMVVGHRFDVGRRGCTRPARRRRAGSGTGVDPTRRRSVLHRNRPRRHTRSRRARSGRRAARPCRIRSPRRWRRTSRRRWTMASSMSAASDRG